MKNNKINPDYAFNPALIIEQQDNPFNDVSSLISRKMNHLSFDKEVLPDVVQLYYQIQNIRDSLLTSTESSELKIYSAYLNNLETSILSVFQDCNAKSTTGTWAISQEGIGQAMSAALLIMVDINKCPTVANLWRFVGLDPKHTKWNPLLKNIAWKMGMSFQHYSAFDTFYGNVYLSDLERRKAMNAKATPTETDDLPESRIEAQARRYATKIFLSHWHHVRYREIHGTDPSNVFVTSTKYISPPNFPYQI